MIRSARLSRGLKQHHVAKATGVTVSAVSQWENEETKPDPELIRPLAEVLGLDPVILSVERIGASDNLPTVKPAMVGKDKLTAHQDPGAALPSGGVGPLQLDDAIAKRGRSNPAPFCADYSGAVG